MRIFKASGSYAEASEFLDLGTTDATHEFDLSLESVEFQADMVLILAVRRGNKSSPIRWPSTEVEH